jgi:tetratricopeptide (TPR) repeat protein
MLGPEHLDVAPVLSGLGTLWREEGKYSKAQIVFQRALSIRQKALGPENPDVAMTLNNLAAVYRSQGNYKDAELLYRRTLLIWEKALPRTHPNVATVLANLATDQVHLPWTIGNGSCTEN